MGLLLASALAVGGAFPALAADTPSPEALAAPTAAAFAMTPSDGDGGGQRTDARADEPQISMEVSETSEWAMKREGLTVFSWGFAPEANVTIAIDGTVVNEDAADENGDLNFSFTVELAPGEHTVMLTSDGGSASHPFTVIADEEFYDDEYAANFDPAINVSRWVVSESELADEPLRVTGSGFPNSSNPVGPTTVDVVLDGEVVETIRTDIVGAVEAELGGPLSVGRHEVALVSPVGQASRTVEVVPDGQGDPPRAGSYEGTSVQTHADGVQLDDRDERPIRFEIDSSGRIAGLQGEYWWFCAGGSGFKDFADSGFPATPITVNRPFEIRWHDYILYGTVNADGTASGTAWDGMGECGSSILEWSTSVDDDPVPATIPATAPTEDDLDPALEGAISAPAEAAAGETITVTVTGVEAGTEVGVWLFSEPAVYLGTRSLDENGEIVVTIPAGTQPGAHKLAVWAAPDAQIGWTGIRIVSDDGGGGADGGAGGSDDGGGADGGTGGSDDGGDVDGGTGGSDDGELPDTGAPSLMLAVALGALLLVIGPGLMLRTRRRLVE